MYCTTRIINPAKKKKKKKKKKNRGSDNLTPKLPLLSCCRAVCYVLCYVRLLALSLAFRIYNIQHTNIYTNIPTLPTVPTECISTSSPATPPHPTTRPTHPALFCLVSVSPLLLLYSTLLLLYATLTLLYTCKVTSTKHNACNARNATHAMHRTHARAAGGGRRLPHFTMYGWIICTVVLYIQYMHISIYPT